MAMSISRRGAVRTVAGLGLALTNGGLVPKALAASVRSIPTHAMVLTRQLYRSLQDGGHITVTRRWRIEFFEQGRGIGILGEQISAEVDAPAILAGLAKIEEERSTDQMWPILLSQNGLVLAAGRGTSPADLAAARDEALRVIAEKPMPVQERAGIREYLAKVTQSGSKLLDRLPADLFYPAGSTERIRQPLELPGGIIGEFELSYSAIPSAQGWLERATREVITRVSDSESRAREEWTLERI